MPRSSCAGTTHRVLREKEALLTRSTSVDAVAETAVQLVALIELEADGDSLGLASGTLTLGVPETHLAISLLVPTELKDFGNEELAQVPIEDVDGSIDLLPQKTGSWRGAASLLDGRSIEVVFDPE